MCGEQNYVNVLVSLWTQAVIWGIYVVLFAGCLYVLVWQPRDRPRFLLPISIIMFLICSTLVVIDFVLVLLTPDMTANSFDVGEVRHSCATETTSHLSQALLDDLMRPVNDSLFSTNLLLADGLLIYRCFVLWKETRWGRCIVVLPILLLLATSATGYAQIYYDLEMWHIRRDSPLSEAIPPPNWFAFTELSSYFSNATYILSLATTVLTTLLIASRIWWLTRELEKGLGRRVGSMYRRSMTLVIESGAMYSVSLIVIVAVWFTAPSYTSIPEYAMRQIMGIAPTLIIVRLGLGEGVESTIQELSASRTSRGITFARVEDDAESYHEPCSIQAEPSSNKMADRPKSSVEVTISRRMSGSPPVEGAKLEGFNICKHWDSGSE